MGKSKKINRLIFISISLLVLALFLFWLFYFPKVEKSRILSWLNTHELQLQAEQWDISRWGDQLTIKNPLLTSPQVLEYPLLSAKEIKVNSRTNSLEIVQPKITGVFAQRTLTQLITVAQDLLSERMDIKITNGDLELWDKQAFTGIQFRVTQINLSAKRFSPTNLSFSFTVPGGFSSLTSFAPSSRFFQNETFSLSAQASLYSWKEGELKNLKWETQNRTFFQAAQINWKEETLLSINVVEPQFDFEYTHAGRWKIFGQIVRSLTHLRNELFDDWRWPAFELTSDKGAIRITDKYVFPLFSETVEKAKLSIGTQNDAWQINLQGDHKGSPGKVDLTGLYPEVGPLRLQKATFNEMPIDPFFSYYYRDLPYESISGTFSGVLENQTLFLTLNNFLGAIKSDDPKDLLKEETGLPTPLLFALLQDEKGKLQIQVPFQRNWRIPFAHYCATRLKNELEGIANIKTQENKIISFTWIPFYFDPGKTLLTEKEQKKLHRIGQWLTFLPNGSLEIQANIGSSATIFDKWVVQVDSEGNRYLEEVSTSIAQESISLAPDEIASSRVDSIREFLVKQLGISSKQIQILPSTELPQNSVSYRLIVPEL